MQRAAYMNMNMNMNNVEENMNNVESIEDSAIDASVEDCYEA